jgi:hypothetical protein
MAQPTEPIASEAPARSRRAVLVGALTGLGISIGQAVIKPLAARAAGNDGQNVVVGGFYDDVRSQTTIADQTNAERVLWVASNTGNGGGNGTAVTGFSNSGTGIEGWSNTGTGVYGHGNTYGVRAESATSFGLYANSPDYIAVYGYSENGKGLQGHGGNTGVYAYGGVVGAYANSPTGTALRSETTSGTAIEAMGGTGIALRTDARVKFDKVSGRATITAGHTTVTVTPGVNVTSSSFVLLTPMSNIGTRGLWVTTDAANDQFKIHISSSRSASTKVGWLLLG